MDKSCKISSIVLSALLLTLPKPGTVLYLAKGGPYRSYMYQVPQFIQYETKVFGPLTFRQAIFIIGAIVIIFITYIFLGKTHLLVFAIISSLVGGLGFALAFLRVYGRTFGEALFSVIGFLFGSRTYVWHRQGRPSFQQPSPRISRTEEAGRAPAEQKSPLAFGERSHIQRLSWKVGFKKRPEEE